MVVIFHPRPPPTQPPVAVGNDQPGMPEQLIIHCIATRIRRITLTVDNGPLIQQGLDRPDEDTSEAVFGIPQQPESSTTSLGNCIFYSRALN